MKFLKVNINYKEMLGDFFRKYPNINDMDYDDIIKCYFKEAYWPSQGLEKALSNKYQWKCNSIIFTLEESAQNDIFFTKWCEKHNFKNVKQNRFDNLLLQILYYKPDIIYFHEIWFYELDFFIKLRFLLKNIIIMGWDCAPRTSCNMYRLRYTDKVFTCSKHKEEQFLEHGINSLLVGHFFDKDMLKTLPVSKKEYDIVFAGTLDMSTCDGRVHLLKELISQGINLKIFGKTNDPDLQPFCCEPVFGNEFLNVLHRAKIVLNLHVTDDIKYSGNIRMYEATGVGSLLLTDYKEDMKSKFVLNEEVITYTSVNDLIQKIRYYLQNEKIREIIALNGQKRTLNDYTYDSFADIIYKQIVLMKQKPDEYLKKCFNNLELQKFDYSYKPLFNTLSNILIRKTQQLVKLYTKIALYGNGNVASIIKKHIPNLVIIADKVKEEDDNQVCYPHNLNQYEFDIIIVTVLDREEEIIIFLEDIMNIPKSKIITFELNLITGV